MRIGCLLAKYNDGTVKCIEASENIQALKDLRRGIKNDGGIKGVTQIYLMTQFESRDRFKEKPKEVVEVKDEKPKGRK